MRTPEEFKYYFDGNIDISDKLAYIYTKQKEEMGELYNQKHETVTDADLTILFAMIMFFTAYLTAKADSKSQQQLIHKLIMEQCGESGEAINNKAISIANKIIDEYLEFDSIYPDELTSAKLLGSCLTVVANEMKNLGTGRIKVDLIYDANIASTCLYRLNCIFPREFL